MNKIMKSAVSVAILLLAQSALACDYPKRVDMPNGATAGKEAMIAGQKDVKAYMAAMDEYLSCIESEEVEAVLGMGDVDEKSKRQREDMVNKK